MENFVDNRYRLLELLGRGGMADVHLAHDEVLDRRVALKVLAPSWEGEGVFVERFVREARSGAALSHPNIVSVYDRGETEEGTYYIAMEYLPGPTLKEVIEGRGTFTPEAAAAVGAQVARALGEAHQKGMVHRDIKPQNILFTTTSEEEVKVTDFGLARTRHDATITQSGAVLGTANYLSPEQALGEEVGPESDLYSLGVVLYEMLTGELPFEGDTTLGVAMKHVNGQLTPPREIEPAIPQELEAVILRLLSKSPADRYPGAHELSRELEEAVEGGFQSEKVPPPPTEELSSKGRKRRPWRRLLVAAACAVVGTAVILGAIAAGSALWPRQVGMGVSGVITPTVAPTAELPANTQPPDSSGNSAPVSAGGSDSGAGSDPSSGRDSAPNSGGESDPNSGAGGGNPGNEVLGGGNPPPPTDPPSGGGSQGGLEGGTPPPPAEPPGGDSPQGDQYR